MELERYHELRTLLQQWKARLAENIRRQIEDSGYWLARMQAIYNNEGTDEEFTLWLDRWCRQAAIQFILRVLFLRVLEDRDLLGTTRLRTTDGQKMWARLTRNLGAAGYVQWCCWDAAHLLPDLFGPTEYDLLLPEDELVQRFLDEVWRRPDSNRPGWLRFDFRPEPEKGDQGFQTRFIGDLYQELDAEIRARYALLQTPHFISQFILEHTLLKRFEEKDFREVTMIDPTIGSGHFAVDGFWMFITQYEKAAGKRREQLTRVERATIAQTIIERHLFGCDINPYATALARFRLLLAACDYAQPASLRELRDAHFNLITIDSLIPYERLTIRNIQSASKIAQVLGQPEAIERALPVLRNRYDVVVGNPPYIQVKDRAKRDLYREQYKSAYSKFGLSAPFTERFVQLANDQGRVGLISSNAFAGRQFGKKLIEEVLPKYDLNMIIDLSGAFIPGHGTPTLILFAKNQAPSLSEVVVLSNNRGEPSTPSNPAQGEVWKSVLRGIVEGPGYVDDFVDVAARPQKDLAEHPWQFGGAKSRLYERIVRQNPKRLEDVVESVGITLFTLTDEVFVFPPDFARRQGFAQKYLRWMVVGESLRDWIIKETPLALFPYERDFKPFDVEAHPAEKRYLEAHRDTLANTVLFAGRTKVESGYQWFEYGRLTSSKYATPSTVALAEISTHNHATLSDNRTSRLFKQTIQVIKLGTDYGFEDYALIAGVMNTCLACFCLKQVCFNKGAGDDPVRDRYVHSGNYVSTLPFAQFGGAKKVSHQQMLELALMMQDLSEILPTLLQRNILEKESEAYQKWYSSLGGYRPPHSDLSNDFTSAGQLKCVCKWAQTLYESIRQRMIFLQEEMDWVAYEMYGLIKKAPTAEDYLTPEDYQQARLQLGQRPFEIAGRGYTGDWHEGYIPDRLPEYLKPLTDARIAIIETNEDIALLEDPLYKRRWVPPDYEKEFREAAEWWLAEKLEYALEQYGKPISLRRWAGLLTHDERVNATLEVLTGSPMFDLEQELLKIIQANAVSNRPEHYLKPEGLRKFHIQGAEFKSSDFSDSVAWKIRGKLNIPRERFIAYTEFDATQRGVDAPENGGPWYGWAGWDAAQRAEALVYLLEQAGRAGWELHFRQCGLRAALRDLLHKNELDPLPEADRLEFEGIAAMCGIGLDTACYCQAYRDGMARGEPGVPGVGEAALQVKALAVSSRSGKDRNKQDANKANQMRLDL